MAAFVSATKFDSTESCVWPFAFANQELRYCYTMVRLIE